MRKKLGELLVEAGATTPEEIRNALGNQRAWGAGQKLGQVLVHMGQATQAQVARALAVQFDLPYVELPEIPDTVSRLVPLDFQAEHGIVPFFLEREGKVERLHVAVSDPAALGMVDELRFQLGKPVRLFIAAKDDLEAVVAALRGESEDPLDAIEVSDDGEELELETQPAHSVPGGWFATAPGEPAVPPPAPAPAGQATAPSTTEPAPPKPQITSSVPTPPPLPLEWDLPPASTEGEGGTRQVSASPLDDLLGGLAPAAAPMGDPRTPPGTKPVQVVHFPPQPRPPTPVVADVEVDVEEPLPGESPKLEFSDADLQILEDLERMATGEAPELQSEKVKPAQMVAALIRLLIRKGVVVEAEFLEELGRK